MKHVVLRTSGSTDSTEDFQNKSNSKSFQTLEAYLRLTAGDEWGLTQGVTQGVTLGVTLGVTEGVQLGVDCADVVSLSSLKSPLGILNFCKDRKTSNSTNMQ